MSKFTSSKYNLFRLLVVLDRAELRRFGQFLQSPYFNSDKRYFDFFKILKSYYPHFNSRQLSKERLFWRLFPEDPEYDDLKLRRYFSGMLKLIERFLVTESVNDEGSYQKLLVQAYRKRGLYTTYNKKFTKAIEALKSNPIKDFEYHQELFQLHHNHYFYNASEKYDTGTIFKRSLAHLDQAYLIVKLRYMVEKTSRANILQYEQSILLEQAILEVCETLKADHFLLHLYYNIYGLINKTKKDDVLFQETKALYFEHIDYISRDEQQAILETLLNYLIYHNKSNYSIYGHQQLELYQKGLEQELFLYKGRMLDDTFMNIAVTACILKAFDFVNHFIKTYEHYLEPSIRESAVQLSKAYLHFHKSDFEKANHLALITNNNLVKYSLRARSLAVRCQFEFFQKDHAHGELLVSTINQFLKFLKKHRAIAPRISQPYVALLDSLKLIVKQMKKSHAKNIKIDKEALLTHIQEKPAMISRKWLIQKIESLN